MGKEMSFEAAMEQLDGILEQLSGDGLKLDDSVKQYAKAAELIELCHKKLEDAKVRVEEIDARIGRIGDEDDV